MPSRDFITPHLVLQELLDIANISLQNVNIIALGIGPGSYTGLRNAASVMKTIAYRYPDVKIVVVPSLVGYLPHIEESRIADSMPIVILEDAKIGGFYVQKVEKANNFQMRYSPSQVVLAKDIESYVRASKKITSRRPASWIYQKIPDKSLEIERIIIEKYIQTFSVNFNAIGEYICAQFKEKNVISWHEVEIDYLRKTQAELEREQKNMLM